MARRSFRRATAPLLVWIALVLAPSMAIAEPGSRSTLSIDGGVRLPWGSTASGDRAVRELVEFEFTSEVVVAFPVSEHFLIGPMAGSAWLWPGRAMRAVCHAARAQGHEACSSEGLGLRLGVRGEWHPLRGQSFGPWLGVQSGYEFLLIGRREGGVGFEEHLNGFELFSIRVGADVAAGPQLRLGAFAGWGIGTFMSRSARCSRNCGDLSPEVGPIGKPSLHHHVVFGLRLEIDPRKPR